ncbi:hypothetical protein ABFS82_08G131100 [Erythranthe guttata]|nr:PREDICTED: transcription factor bHLH144 [Erythranthe guttata]|eukprot:XP_012830257.1 PREDICTED: transcription factor bHLH144 [Erythranthe guttata]
MHSHSPYLSDKPMPPLGDQTGYSYMQNAPIPSLVNGFIPPGIKPLLPLRNLDIHPSTACPKNYIIFDQTENRSQVMFHPDISSKMFYPGLEKSIFQENVCKQDENEDGNISSTLKEDENDIDALLSTEYEDDEENGESEDEVMSTARTVAKYEYDSSDSCSNYESVSRKTRRVFGEKSSGTFRKKGERVRKMVKALRGIVPGGNRMSNVDVLDEAVRYLKSLRVEVKKMGLEKIIERVKKSNE